MTTAARVPEPTSSQATCTATIAIATPPKACGAMRAASTSSEQNQQACETTCPSPTHDSSSQHGGTAAHRTTRGRSVLPVGEAIGRRTRRPGWPAPRARASVLRHDDAEQLGRRRVAHRRACPSGRAQAGMPEVGNEDDRVAVIQQRPELRRTVKAAGDEHDVRQPTADRNDRPGVAAVDTGAGLRLAALHREHRVARRSRRTGVVVDCHVLQRQRPGAVAEGVARSRRHPPRRRSAAPFRLDQQGASAHRGEMCADGYRDVPGQRHLGCVRQEQDLLRPGHDPVRSGLRRVQRSRWRTAGGRAAGRRAAGRRTRRRSRTLCVAVRSAGPRRARARAAQCERGGENDAGSRRRGRRGYARRLDHTHTACCTAFAVLSSRRRRDTTARLARSIVRSEAPAGIDRLLQLGARHGGAVVRRGPRVLRRDPGRAGRRGIAHRDGHEVADCCWPLSETRDSSAREESARRNRWRTASATGATVNSPAFVSRSRWALIGETRRPPAWR